MRQLTIEISGEVTMIGKSYYGPGSQRIEIDCKGFGVESAALYLHFKGESPYALGDKITLTIEPHSELQTPINIEEGKTDADN